MSAFLNDLLADARWYVCSIFFAAALIVDFYMVSHSPVSGLGVTLALGMSIVMAGCIYMLLRSLKSKKPRDPGRQPGESGSLHFRAAAGKKSK